MGGKGISSRKEHPTMKSRPRSHGKSRKRSIFFRRVESSNYLYKKTHQLQACVPFLPRFVSSSAPPSATVHATPHSSPHRQETQADSSRLELEAPPDSKDSSPLGSCTRLVYRPANTDRVRCVDIMSHSSYKTCSPVFIFLFFGFSNSIGGAILNLRKARRD